MAETSTLKDTAEKAPAQKPDDTFTQSIADPADNAIYQRIKAQSELRDSLSKTDSTVYIVCSDGRAADCDAGNGGRWISPSTAHARRMTEEVSEAFEGSSLKTSLKGWTGPVELYNFLSGGSSPTSRASMRADRTGYLDTVTRPNEIKLVDALSKTTGEIKHSQLVKAALDACDNDRKLAMLTLNNFTKSMAGIERRQIAAEQIAPELKETYTKAKIDSIFNRLEGLSDDPNEKYNKESAIYHFYGAIFAASKIGPGSNLGVFAYNNFNLRPLGYGGRADRIIDSTSRLGAQFWWGLTIKEQADLNYSMP